MHVDDGDRGGECVGRICGALVPLFVVREDEALSAEVRALEEQLGVADTLPPVYGAVDPPCFCPTSTPWVSRRNDGTWECGTIESRTCLSCGASLSRVVSR